MKSYIILLFLGLSSLIQSQSKPLLLHKYLKSESQYFSEFGNESDLFVENKKAVDPKIVLQDFAKINQLTSINSDDYKIKTIQDGKHRVTIYKNSSKIKPYKIIEIVTRDSSKHKKTPLERIKYLIVSKTQPKKVELDIDENGISDYAINNRKKYCLRISVLYIEDEFDYSVFQEMDAIMEKYKNK